MVTGNAMANAAVLGAVEVKSFTTTDFRPQSGEVLPELKLLRGSKKQI